jgi:hypothetical protein
MRVEQLKNDYLEKLYRGFYANQNKKIHAARAQLRMTLDQCRELAREIGGKPSISSLSLAQRSELLEELRRRGADIFIPKIPSELVSPRAKTITSPKVQNYNESSTHESERKASSSTLFPIHLQYWNGRFPRDRRGFPTNRQLAMIQTLWDLYFNDNRPGRGLRGLIWRQTRHLPGGPISDLAFLQLHHVEAVLMPLVARRANVMRGRMKGGEDLQ